MELGGRLPRGVGRDGPPRRISLAYVVEGKHGTQPPPDAFVLDPVVEKPGVVPVVVVEVEGHTLVVDALLALSNVLIVRLAVGHDPDLHARYPRHVGEAQEDARDVGRVARDAHETLVWPVVLVVVFRRFQAIRREGVVDEDPAVSDLLWRVGPVVDGRNAAP